ncbi:hypothetical protein J1792_32590 [Streptomyces triculaminicus]|uniref:DUF4760 domain-containing protein n=1 Tax=Streptomyces triculaminicus TaxID=2816232 RepID=A0A939JS53_9ACTN|nr:hypothetical protein [Streptomyces triculaminicus]MBO0657283.1 hypothetical protein [Streptomyces triculaminicus]
METIIGVVATLVGVFVGASLTQRSADRQRRLIATFDLHRELHGAEMMRARFAAAELVEQHADKDYRELRDLLGAPAMSDLRQVIYFFQRLWLAIELGALHEECAARLFGDTFSWWYDTTFQSMLVPSETEMARDIEALHGWLVSHATEAQQQYWRGADPDAWRRRDA